MICPVCQTEVQPGERIETSFSKEGTWCNHAGWVLRTGATRDDPPILGGVPLPDRIDGAIAL